MDLRDHISRETSAFVERMIAAADAAAAKVRLEADETIAGLRREVDEVNVKLEAETSRAAGASDRLDAEISKNTTLAAEFDAATSRASSLAAQLDAISARVNPLTTQLDAERARASALSAELEEERSRSAALAAQLETETAQHASVAGQLERERARARALAEDLASVSAALRAAEDARAQATASIEGASTEVRSLREMLESARAEAIRTAETLEAEATQNALLQQAHETTVAELQARIEAAAGTTNALEASLRQAETSACEAEDASALRVEALQQQLDQQVELVRVSSARVEAAEAAAARMRDELTEANAITDAAGGEMTTLRGRVGRITSVLTAAATSLERLGTARTVAELYAALIRELATEFSRAAIFRVKGNHLEGDLAVGVDTAIDIQKIVVPLGISSVLTRAAGGGGVQHAKKEAGDSRAPFGGSPELAFAAPLLFEGEVVAVAYADSEAVLHEGQVSFAGLLVQHANAVLVGMAQELRTVSQLRDYARTLLTEVAVMFTADIDAGIPDPSRHERLRGNIDFARDLYAQRAALGAPVSANLLDDEIGRMLRGAEPSTPFASALAAVENIRTPLGVSVGRG